MNQTPNPLPDGPAGDGDTGQRHRPEVAMTALSDELRALLAAAQGQSMTIGQILDHLKDRGHAMFIIVVIGPFLFLPTTFGLSAPIGMAIAWIGLCITLGMKPWLPGFLVRKVFPYEALEKVIERAAKLSARVERLARPRLGVMLWPGFMNLAGIELVLWALLMALPGPNFLFAFMITLLAFGLLMRDGLFLLVAHVLTFISPVLVFLFWDQIVTVTLAMWDKLMGLWDKAAGLIAATPMG